MEEEIYIHIMELINSAEDEMCGETLNKEQYIAFSIKLSGFINRLCKSLEA